MISSHNGLLNSMWQDGVNSNYHISCKNHQNNFTQMNHQKGQVFDDEESFFQSFASQLVNSDSSSEQQHSVSQGTQNLSQIRDVKGSEMYSVYSKTQSQMPSSSPALYNLPSAHQSSLSSNCALEAARFQNVYQSRQQQYAQQYHNSPKQGPAAHSSFNGRSFNEHHSYNSSFNSQLSNTASMQSCQQTINSAAYDARISAQFFHELRAAREKFVPLIKKSIAVREMQGFQMDEIRQFQNMVEQLQREESWYRRAGKVVTTTDYLQLKDFVQKLIEYFNQPRVQERLRAFDEYIRRSQEEAMKCAQQQKEWNSKPPTTAPLSPCTSGASGDTEVKAFSNDRQQRATSQGSSRSSASGDLESRISALRDLGARLQQEIDAINSVYQAHGVTCQLHNMTNEKLDHLVVKCCVTKPTGSCNAATDQLAAISRQSLLENASPEEWRALQACRLDIYVHVDYPEFAPRAAFDEPKWEWERNTLKANVKEAFRATMGNLPKPIRVNHVVDAFYSALLAADLELV